MLCSSCRYIRVGMKVKDLISLLYKEAFAAKALMQLKDMIQSKEDNEETTEE